MLDARGHRAARAIPGRGCAHRTPPHRHEQRRPPHARPGSLSCLQLRRRCSIASATSSAVRPRSSFQRCGMRQVRAQSAMSAPVRRHPRLRWRLSAPARGVPTGRATLVPSAIRATLPASTDQERGSSPPLGATPRPGSRARRRGDGADEPPRIGARRPCRARRPGTLTHRSPLLGPHAPPTRGRRHAPRRWSPARVEAAHSCRRTRASGQLHRHLRRVGVCAPPAATASGHLGEFARRARSRVSRVGAETVVSCARTTRSRRSTLLRCCSTQTDAASRSAALFPQSPSPLHLSVCPTSSIVLVRPWSSSCVPLPCADDGVSASPRFNLPLNSYRSRALFAPRDTTKT